MEFGKYKTDFIMRDYYSFILLPKQFLEVKNKNTEELAAGNGNDPVRLTATY